MMVPVIAPSFRRRALAAVVIGVLGAGLLVGCADELNGNGGEPGRTGPRTISVPADAPTIQRAVDAAKDGDTVEISPGTYGESVRIDTPGIRLVGRDRNGVIIDGGDLRPNGIVVTADRVVVANLTVRRHTLNGVLVTGMSDENGGLARGSDGYTRLDPAKFPPVEGFAVRGVTSVNNGLYGVYAFDAHNGVIEQSYASGHADSGIYVGQCRQCRIVVRDNVAELNAVGYEQANASDSVVVAGNRLTRNRVGLTLLSNYEEALVPQRAGTVVGNLVADNADPMTPAQAEGGFGIGIGLSGAVDSRVLRNRITGNPRAGVVIGSSADLPPTDNRLLGNVASGNGVDLWYAASARAPGTGNCAEEGQFPTTRPSLGAPWECTDDPRGGGAGVPLPASDAPPGISFRAVATPPTQPQLPVGLATAPAGAPAVDVDAIRVPATTLLADRAHR